MRSHYRLITLFVFVLLIPIGILGQNETDVVRYFDTSPIGTARLSSMAGSFGALGGDLSAISINPAGSAIYRKSDVVLTPGFTFNTVSSDANGNTNDDNRNKFVFSNLGYATTTAGDGNESFYLAYSMGYTKTMDYNRNSSLAYANNSSSMLFSFTDRAYGIPSYFLPDEDPFASNLAYETYLIDPVEDTPVYYTTQPLYEESFNGVNQSNSIEEIGSMGEVFFNIGLAIKERVHIGATMTFVKGDYEQSLSFREDSTVDSLLLDNFIFRYNQKSAMSGLNLKFGLIFKPEDWLRLGLAWHVPYQLVVNDEFSTGIRSQFKDGEFFDVESPLGSIEYNLKNPGKWIFSAALVGKDRGLINFDFEWMNYSGSKIISSDFDFTEENQQIANALRNTLTIRIGGEIWAGRYNFRAGYAYRQNPYANTDISKSGHYNTYSIGTGFVSDNNIYVNLSANYQQDGRSYYPYNDDMAPLISDKYRSILILTSVGLRF